MTSNQSINGLAEIVAAAAIVPPLDNRRLAEIMNATANMPALDNGRLAEMMNATIDMPGLTSMQAAASVFAAKINDFLEPLQRASIVLAEYIRPVSEHMAQVGAAINGVMSLQERRELEKMRTASITDMLNSVDLRNLTATRTIADVFKTQESARSAIADFALPLAKISDRLTLTEAVANIDFDFIMRSASNFPGFGELKEAVDRTAISYKLLAAENSVVFPQFVLPGATRELFTTSLTTEAICIPDERENGRHVDEDLIDRELDFCEGILKNINPALVIPLRGARAVIRDDHNPDRARHVLTSLRELWKHLLAHLAPDKAVTAWAGKQGENDDLFYKGSPTRKARLKYICQKYESDSLCDFLIEDTNSIQGLIHFCNKLHEVPTITTRQAHLLLIKSDSLLLYILRISQEL